MKRYLCGDFRIEVYDNGIIRAEYAADGAFYDGDTFFVPDRASLGRAVTVETVKDAVRVGDYDILLPVSAGLKGLKVFRGDKAVYKYKKLCNSGELPPPGKTPELFAISDSPRITVPVGGYSAERTGEYSVTENVCDIYILPCRRDALLLRKLYVELTGRCELVRLSALGGWNSKYYRYTQAEAEKLITDYERYGVPLDNVVIDTDWRVSKRGQGYEINTELFPDLRGFFAFAHANGVEVMFNDHPEPKASVFSPEEIEYRESNLKRILDMGLDYWWYDRNWWTKLISPTSVAAETLGLYLFSDITASHYKAKSNGAPYRRPVIMGNVVNVKNGRYLGISDSASHRYSIQWTGDIHCAPDSFSREIENLIRCSDNCIAYVNSDCGGHIGDPDKALFIRWMQFGSLSPVLRPHCTCSVRRTREPWLYDEETLYIVREYIKLRYRLLPVIYRAAYENYETGAPIFKSLGYGREHDRIACKNKKDYMLGDNILISPIAGERYELVGRKNYTEKVRVSYYDGRELLGGPIAETELDTVFMDLPDGVSPAEGVPCHDFSARYTTSVKFNGAVMLYVKCDDGSTVYVDGKKVLEDKTTHAATLFPLCVLDDGNKHSIVIEYFQAGGEAYLALFAVAVKEKPHKTYLPEGEWMGVFDGRKHNGGRYVRAHYGIREMPLFVRRGAVIPLAYDAQNTKSLSFREMVLDYYASKTGSDTGYIYEDDGETVAYKSGECKKTRYSAEYNADKNAYVLRIYRAEGRFYGERAFDERVFTVKLHIVEKITAVYVNGAAAEYKILKRDPSAFPFGTGAAPDSDTAVVSFKARSNGEYKIEFML